MQTSKEWRTKKIKLSLKNKIIILSSFAVAVLITATILLFTFFALDASKVEVNFLNASLHEQDNTFAAALLESGQIKNKSSVFFLNKKKATDLIEKAHPYIKVVNIETVFPNSLKINIAQREELFAVKNNLDHYSVMDADFKVLRVLSQSEYNLLEQKPILVEFAGSHLINLSAGAFVPNTEETLLFNNLAKSFLIQSRDVVEQKTIFKKVVLLNNLFLLTLQDDFEIKIHFPVEELNQKVGAMFVRMGQIYPDYQTGYIMEVHLTQDGQLLSRFTLKN